MDITEEYSYHFRKFEELVEDEKMRASYCIGGEMLEKYLQMIKAEMDELEKKSNPTLTITANIY